MNIPIDPYKNIPRSSESRPLTHNGFQFIHENGGWCMESGQLKQYLEWRMGMNKTELIIRKTVTLANFTTHIIYASTSTLSTCNK